MDESDSALEAMLVAAVKAIWHSPDRDQLTVNNVYKRAEADNGLGDRYFKNEARKDWSRAIVMAAVVSGMVSLFIGVFTSFALVSMYSLVVNRDARQDKRRGLIDLCFLGRAEQTGRKRC